MKVALDGTPLTVSSGGTRRYTTQLLESLKAAFPEDEFELLSDQLAAPGLLERRWWSAGLPRALARRGIDVFHGTDFAVPYLPIRPSVLSLHDLSPWMEPSWHHAADRVRRRTPYLLRLGLATMVLTLSEAVRRAAIDWFRLHPSRVVAVPLAAPESFRPAPRLAAEPPYFLYLGTLEPRKNIGMLIDAWQSVRERHNVRLVLAGRRRADFAEPPPRPGLEMPGEVPDAELPALYTNAIAVLYPSFYEGFGLPVLEAMQCGAAVVASRDPAISEVAAGAALQLDARDASAWAAAMTAAIECPERMRAWRDRGMRRAAEFSWARTARLTREVYDEARRRFHE